MEAASAKLVKNGNKTNPRHEICLQQGGSKHDGTTGPGANKGQRQGPLETLES